MTKTLTERLAELDALSVRANWPEEEPDYSELARDAVAAVPVWRDIESAPKDIPIVAKTIDGWVATIMLHEDNSHWTDGASVLHYNGAVLVAGFKGQFTHYMLPENALPTPPKGE